MGRYDFRDIDEDDELKKTRALRRLMCELNDGKRSGEEEGYLSSETVRYYFQKYNERTALQSFPDHPDEGRLS